MKTSLNRSLTSSAICLLGVAFISSAALAAVPPQIENRTPQVGEIGYRPGDGEVAEFNPPSLTWLHEKPARTYIVQWAADPEFNKSLIISNLPFNCYTHSAGLPTGKYFWRYRFQAADGQESAWSKTRQFTISPESIPFPLPSRDQRRQLIPQSHPRLFVRPEDVPRLRAAATGPEAKRFEELRAAADKLVGKPLTPEPTQPGTAANKTNVALLQNWWANRVQTLRACTEAETAAFVYLVTGERRYGEDARRRILDLASWNPDGETNFRRNCEAGKPLLHRLARAYDWAWDTLSAEDRAKVRQAVLRRIQDAWESGEVGRGVGHLNSPLNSHGNRTWHKIGESGIVFLGEIPEAELWLDYALNKFYACYPVWSDADGGWHEGLSYWGGYMSKAVWWLHAAQVAFRIDGFRKPFFDHVGDYALYAAPPGTHSMGFGDLSDRQPPAGWGGFLEYFLRNAPNRARNNAPYWRWWSDQWKLEPQDGILGFLYHATMSSLPEPKPPADLPPSKVFRGIGVASLHDTLLDAREDVHFLLKSSPFGGMSHGHNAQNAFQLTAYGETLLPACVYRDWHGTAFHEKWVWQTISQNAVLVNGRGQLAHSGKAAGRIVTNEFSSDWDYVCGDAVAAYEGRLTRALRHVAFVKPDLIVIFDELAAPEPATFQFMLHATTAFELDAPAQRLRVQRPRAGVTIQYLAPAPLAFKQWDGYQPKPIRDTIPNQWHVEAGTSAKERSAGVLTLLAVHRGRTVPELKAERVEAATAVGVRAVWNGRTVAVAFRKSGAAMGEIGGKAFSGAVLVRSESGR